MSIAEEETAKRLKVADDFVNNMNDKAFGILMVGSVAYAPNKSVNENSDLDLVVIYSDIKDSLPIYFKHENEQKYLLGEKYDGFHAKRNSQGIPVSIHNISFEALETISKAGYEFLTYYRQSAKDITYYSKDFDNIIHPFNIKSEPIQGQVGVKRFEYVSLHMDGKFVIGNDMDKLLSNSIILHDTNDNIKKNINELWKNVSARLVEHHKAFNKEFEASKADIAPFLCRYNRFSPDVKDGLKQRTQNALKLLVI